MTFLPIVDRELRIASRLAATYRNRSISVGIVALVAIIMLLFGVFSSTASQVGAGMFWTLSYLALAFCLFEGVRKTADCLSEEKREGTLGLLFLTDLKGYDVVLGKLAATSLNSLYGLFSMLPILALPLLLGGVTPAEFWRIALALLSNLFFSLCLGIFISAYCRNERTAMGATLFGMLVVCGGPLVHPVNWVVLISPLYAFLHADFATYSVQPREYWTSLAIVQAIACSLLALASRTVVRSWQNDGAGARKRKFVLPWRRQVRRSPGFLKQRRELLDVNPVTWMALFAGTNSAQSWVLWACFGCSLFLGGILLFSDNNLFFLPGFLTFSMLINLVVKMRLATQASHFFAEARRNNALEMLLVTPLRVHEIVDGQLIALKKMFQWPILAILTCQIAALILYGMIQNAARSAMGGDDPTAMILFVMGYLIIYALDVFAVTYAGMWFGLTSKKEGQAATKTILLVLVAPMCSMILFCLGIPFLFIIPIVCIGVCSGKLHSHLRQIITKRYDSGNVVLVSKTAVQPWQPPK